MEFLANVSDTITMVFEAPSPSTEWFLMVRPWPTILIFFVYVLVIKVSRLMRLFNFGSYFNEYFTRFSDKDSCTKSEFAISK